MARPSVQSTAAQAASTTLEAGRAATSARGRGVAVGLQPHVLRPLAQQQIDGHQHHQDQEPHGHAGRAPARALDQQLQPGQQRDRADADPGEGDAHGQAAPAHEPVGQEQRLARIAQAHAAAADQHAQRQVEMPGLAGERRQQQARAHQRDAQLHHHARAGAIHDAAERRAQHRRDEEAEREGAGRDAALPAELVEDRRKQQRESRARIDADAHGDEGDGDDHPAIENRSTRHQFSRTILSTSAP